jgi:hypothetical protein
MPAPVISASNMRQEQAAGAIRLDTAAPIQPGLLCGIELDIQATRGQEAFSGRDWLLSMIGAAQPRKNRCYRASACFLMASLIAM